MECKNRIISLCLSLFLILLPDHSSASIDSDHTDEDAGRFEELYNYYQSQGLDFIEVNDPSSTNSRDWFKTDLEKYKVWQNRSDFLKAKRRAYASYSFDKKKQTHEIPYYSMQSWGVLNHPPLSNNPSSLESVMSDLDPIDYAKVESRFFDPEFQLEVDDESQTRLTQGNELQLLPNGTSYLEKLRLIRDAKKFLLVNVMHFECDDASQALVMAMGERVRAGVDVRIILEAFHDLLGNAKCKNLMRDQGIEVLSFSDAFDNFGTKKGVNHSKYWIRDGVEAIVGGQNITPGTNLSDGTDFKIRDTDVHIKSGPAVTDLMAVFVDVWDKKKWKKHRNVDAYRNMVSRFANQEKSRLVRGQENYRDWFSDPAKRMHGVCRVVSQRSGSDPISIADVYTKMIGASRDRIFIETPGIKFTEGKVNENKRNDIVVNQLRSRALNDGIKVDLLTNGIGGGMGDFSEILANMVEKSNVKAWDSILTWFDNVLSIGKAKSLRKILLEFEEGKNIRSHQYFNYIHSKMWMFDRIATSVGSWNLDEWSSEKNYETTIICLDETLARTAEMQIAQDLSNAIPLVQKN